MALTTEQIKKQMEENSKAWHTADAATRKQLEAKNQELGKQIGGTYNSASGTWNDSSGKSLYGNSSSGTSGGKSSGTTNSPTTNVDYSTIGMQQMGQGASWQDVQETYNSRANKIANDPNLSQYANDNIQQMMLQYINQQQALEQQQNMIDSWNQSNPQPTYNKPYDPEMEAMLNEILNRDAFSYDAMNDPLYQQYANMYHREGDRAMQETLAEAAAGAGGMNSYAITAAQQAGNYYGSQLNDKIPELYQLAYDMYLTDIDNKVRDLGLLQNMDATQYGRYRDTMNDWSNDRNFAYGAYQDAVNQGNWQTNFGYNSMIDNRDFNYNDYWKNKEFDYNDSWANKEWDANQSQQDIENSRYDKETADAKVWASIEMGVMPSDELLAQAGWNKSDAEKLVAAAKAQMQSGGKGSEGDDTGKYVTDDKGNGYVEKDGKTEKVIDAETIGKGDGRVIGLGIGPINDETLLELVSAGAVILNADGTVNWANGYGPGNYQDALNRLHNSYPGLTLFGF